METSFTPTVLFDNHCPLCRLLAEYSVKRCGERLQFLSWQDFQASRGETPDAHGTDKLRVLTDQGLIENEMAWQWLLEYHPDLSSFNWIAQKIGLSAPAAKLFESGGRALRWLCGCCRKPWNR